MRLARGVLFFLAANFAFAHHSLAALYDTSKLVKLEGVVTRFEWTNPHVLLYMDVKEKSGGTATWGLEIGSPNGLRRIGWTANSVKRGDLVTIEAFPAKDGRNFGVMSTLTARNGTTVLKGDGDGR